MSNQNRVQSGVPAGGQFAASQRDEAEVTLPADAERIDALRVQIASAVDARDWSAVAPLVDRLADAGWNPPCPTCASPMEWESDMAEPDEQWLWCETCSNSYEADAFPELP